MIFATSILPFHSMLVHCLRYKLAWTAFLKIELVSLSMILNTHTILHTRVRLCQFAANTIWNWNIGEYRSIKPRYSDPNERRRKRMQTSHCICKFGRLFFLNESCSIFILTSFVFLYFLFGSQTTDARSKCEQMCLLNFDKSHFIFFKLSKFDKISEAICGKSKRLYHNY